MAKILIVDDDPDFVEITRLVLEQAGHQIVEAANGEEGLTCAKKEKPDLIILDVIMDTVLEGVSISQRMYDDPELRNTPVIMVTSIANTDYAELFPTDEYIHIDAFMSKPITPAGLLRQIDRLLAR